MVTGEGWSLEKDGHWRRVVTGEGWSMEKDGHWRRHDLIYVLFPSAMRSSCRRLLYVCQTNQRKDMCLQPERTCDYNQKGHVFTTRKDMFATRKYMCLQLEMACICNQKRHVFATRKGKRLQLERTCVCNQKGHVFATRKDA